ncbi:MAG: hypothetical protein EAX90_14165 [Candidatus Heimdallarchaeota archaeon]|nr:hypothetical protein [Candidatus Heimdallarchaeota archaeon]
MKSQDLITYKTKITQVLSEIETIKVLSDDNIDCLLRYFRKGPMTIGELVKEFKKEGQIKSESTVYRYVQKMIQNKMVAKAGKRITSINEEEIRSETLYSRTAKIFLITDKLGISDDIDELDKKSCKITRLLLEHYFKDRKSTDKNFLEFLNNLMVIRYENLSKLIESTDESILELFNDLEFTTIQAIMETVSWLSIIDKPEFREEFNKAFK